MMKPDALDTPPVGYVRPTTQKSKGWIIPAQSPQKKTIDRLRQRNQELEAAHAETQAKLDAMEERLAAIETASVDKKKGKGK